MRPVCKDNRNMTMPSVIPDNIAVLGGACDLQESTYGQVAHVMQNLFHLRKVCNLQQHFRFGSFEFLRNFKNIHTNIASTSQ